MKRERLLELAGIITEDQYAMTIAIDALAKEITKMVGPGDVDELVDVMEEVIEQLRRRVEEIGV
jgi:hypothetical protein